MRFKMKLALLRLFLLLLVASASKISFAQNKANFGKSPKIKQKGLKLKTYSSTPKLTRSATDWTKDRLEITGGIGPSVYLGDLGGQDGPAKPFVLDFEPTTTRYSVSAGVRYFLREYHAVRGSFSYARVNGADSLTNYPNRRFRNLNFKSPIVELAGIYEFHVLKPDILHFAGARSTKVFNGSRLGLYGFGGVSMFYFNPKSKFNGDWYALAPLNTEGQGLPDGPKDYKRVSVAVPMGAGAYILLNHNYKLGLEVGYRWTFTDYIDDASGYFYDNQAIESEYGKVAAYFANPSVSLPDVPNSDWYTKDQPRGGFNSNDTYMFVQLTLSKSFGPSISNKPFKQKKSKKKKTTDKKKFTPLKWFKKDNKSKTYKKSDKIKNKQRKFKSPKLNFGKKKKKNKGKVSF